jgi:hypothetical protein
MPTKMCYGARWSDWKPADFFIATELGWLPPEGATICLLLLVKVNF